MSKNQSKKKPKESIISETKRQKGATVKGSLQQDIVRFQLIWVVMGIIFVVMFARLLYIQVIGKDKYQAHGDNLIMTKKQKPSYRGMITDRNNMPLAVSAPLVTVVFSPRDYAIEFYTLKARQQELQGENLTKREQRELDSINKRLIENMSLEKLASLSNRPLQEFQNLVKLQSDLDYQKLIKEFNDNKGKSGKLFDILPKGTGSSYFTLMKEVRPEVAQPLLDAKIVAITSETKYHRYYPQPQPNAYLIGYMGQDKNSKTYEGRLGIEKLYNEMLAGKAGEVLVIRDSKNNSLKEVKETEPEIAGKDLQLTIDSQLQYLLYQELEKIGLEQQAKWATGMVVDIPTGEVLAVSNWPSFNPNNLENIFTDSNNRNHAFVDKFEPGSVMKPITIAIGLKSGQYTESSLINTSPGTLDVGGYTIRDSANYGVISLEKLLQKSSNVGSAKIALSLPPETFSAGQKLFGFGKPTNLNFTLESAGTIPTPNPKAVSSRATVAYGYGMEVTLPQLAQAYSILGANGVLHPLTLIKSTKDSALNSNNVNNVAEPYAKPASTQIIHGKQAKAIVNMMVSVTEPGGTGELASIDGYRVAGKTGTTRIAKLKSENMGAGYHEDKYRTTFAGVAPASNPRFTVVVVIEDPQKEKYGGQVAAPVFRNVMREALRLYNVPYDKPLTGKEPTVTNANTANDL